MFYKYFNEYRRQKWFIPTLARTIQEWRRAQDDSTQKRKTNCGSILNSTPQLLTMRILPCGPLRIEHKSRRSLKPKTPMLTMRPEDCDLIFDQIEVISIPD
jgi:hypothetical protein